MFKTQVCILSALHWIWNSNKISLLNLLWLSRRKFRKLLIGLVSFTFAYIVLPLVFIPILNGKAKTSSTKLPVPTVKIFKCLSLHEFLFTKGHLISKPIHGLLTSPKKRTNEFVLFAFLLFTANISNSSVLFLGESTARQSAFRFYLTFRKGLDFSCIF